MTYIHETNSNQSYNIHVSNFDEIHLNILNFIVFIIDVKRIYIKLIFGKKKPLDQCIQFSRPIYYKST